MGETTLTGIQSARFRMVWGAGWPGVLGRVFGAGGWVGSYMSCHIETCHLGTVSLDHGRMTLTEDFLSCLALWVVVVDILQFPQLPCPSKNPAFLRRPLAI